MVLIIANGAGNNSRIIYLTRQETRNRLPSKETHVMPTHPVTTEQLQRQLEELQRSFEAVTKRDAEFRLEVEAFLRQRKSIVEMPEKETQYPSGVFAWLTPLLQGITVFVVIGCVFWMGQLIGTVSTKGAALQKSAEK